MAREVFDAVQTAENQADQLIQDAQRDARELLKATEAEITDNERKSAQEHRAMYQNLLDSRRAQVSERLTQTQAADDAAQNQELAQAGERLQQVAKLIVERVLDDGNR
ncbi:MAG TPA: hypothetical protein PKJ47_02690 [Candidatus Limiplasma sp.]|nr:hypothetical protein [Candidatus Limiplasma sp.]